MSEVSGWVLIKHQQVLRTVHQLRAVYNQWHKAASHEPTMWYVIMTLFCSAGQQVYPFFDTPDTWPTMSADKIMHFLSPWQKSLQYKNNAITNILIIVQAQCRMSFLLIGQSQSDRWHSVICLYVTTRTAHTDWWPVTWSWCTAVSLAVQQVGIPQ